uniref:Uncharacterized protein n=1 Tax=Lactuca sativa TaxID=4236 RepID=A0A9R1XVV6_LACSA|nr:hypothetical protein LSAT_V11C100047720 [Lactuca sativa]
MPPEEDVNGTLRKWKIKAGKAMFASKTTVEEKMLKHIQEKNTLKEAWDTFVTLFTKNNDMRLKLLENELLLISKKAQMMRIIMQGLRPKYRSLVTTIQGWPVQPSLVDFENLLAIQEAMAKQMGGITLKSEKEAL